MKPQQPAIFHCMVLSSVEYIRIHSDETAEITANLCISPSSHLEKRVFIFSQERMIENYL